MKEGSGAGDWVYIKDSTSLTELVKEELGVAVDLEPEA
jgi:frataxin